VEASAKLTVTSTLSVISSEAMEDFCIAYRHGVARNLIVNVFCFQR